MGGLWKPKAPDNSALLAAQERANKANEEAAKLAEEKAAKAAADAAAADALTKQQEEYRKKNQRGKASTILTSETGVNTTGRTLLGG